MATFAAGLAARRGVARLRYQFAYMERGSKRPDAPALAHAAVRAAASDARCRGRVGPASQVFFEIVIVGNFAE